MRRVSIVLSGLVAVLAIVLFTMFVVRPMRAEYREIEVAIEAEQDLQVQLQQELSRLRELRNDVAAIEGDLAAGEAIIPQDAALPATIRQLQMAADDAGVTLEAITTERPAPFDPAGGLAGITIDLQLSGNYFQLVDFFRRVEDPAISPRGVRWLTATLSEETYPELSASVTAMLFATLPTAPDQPAAPPTDDQGQEPAPADPQAPPDTPPAGPDEPDPDQTPSAPDDGGPPPPPADDEPPADDGVITSAPGPSPTATRGPGQEPA